MDENTKKQIDERMFHEGFPELRWLWERFKSKGAQQPLESRFRSQYRLHASFPGSSVGLLLAGLSAFGLHRNLNTVLDAQGLGEQFLLLLLAGLGAYLMLFLMTGVFRSLVVDWKRIGSGEVAFMLSRPFGHWLRQTEDYLETQNKLAERGVKGWDDPSYRACYRTVDGQLNEVEGPEPQELVQSALRDVLGQKVDGVYQPGRYLSHLKNRKKSVTRFVRAHLDDIQASKRGDLTIGRGLRLLRLLGEEVVAGSAAATHLEQVVVALENPDSVPKGFVEARVWERDPWKDLTCDKDFYSSASLRGADLSETIKRRTKGALGPFGYLHASALTAMDFSNHEGRCVRARLGAAIHRTQKAERTVLFVDGVEGRYDVKPSFIRRALEDYAQRCGFDQIFYYAYPLNKVPRRFVKSLVGEARKEVLDLELVDCSMPLYLDAFGLPLEPWEYARPKGKVVGYSVDTGGGLVSPAKSPGIFEIWARARGAALWLLLLSTMLTLGWVLWDTAPGVLFPTILAFAVALVWERKASRSGLKVADPLDFLAAEIARHPVSETMSYAGRLKEKVDGVRRYFPAPSELPKSLLVQILANPSVKATHLENYFRFVATLEPAQRSLVPIFLDFLWPEQTEPWESLLDSAKKARKKSMKELGKRLDRLRHFLKRVPESGLEPGPLRRLAKVTGLEPAEVLRLVSERPRILRGLRKAPRPVVAALPMVLLGCLLLPLLPTTLPMGMIYALFLGTVAGGTWVLSTRLPVAPGVLTYEAVGRRLAQVTGPGWQEGPVVERMRALGIDTEQYLQARTYENKELQTRIEVRDRREFEGLAQFLTSSEEIGNCIALQNFVSWCLPSLLDDESIVLADVICKGNGRLWQQRAQLWMVAAERDGVPVLTVNSLEFNQEGVKHLERILPELVRVLQDVARRAGFEEVVVGISDYGRSWLDARYGLPTPGQVRKVHSKELGHRYYFDSYRRQGQDWVFMSTRSLSARLYAWTFGAIEWLQGRTHKANAFFETARSRRNAWTIPVGVEASEDFQPPPV